MLDAVARLAEPLARARAHADLRVVTVDDNDASGRRRRGRRNRKSF